MILLQNKHHSSELFYDFLLSVPVFCHFEAIWQ